MDIKTIRTRARFGRQAGAVVAAGKPAHELGETVYLLANATPKEYSSTLGLAA
jgi:hypothetical protein